MVLLRILYRVESKSRRGVAAIDPPFPIVPVGRFPVRKMHKERLVTLDAPKTNMT